MFNCKKVQNMLFRLAAPKEMNLLKVSGVCLWLLKKKH